mmetsp:Transcript_32559/g.98242  ORF Transcript_32559/g.98242 Transcript_32559/m.98242 type:complete len:275 (+) Transcript_32559:12228-13052(+)
MVIISGPLCCLSSTIHLVEESSVSNRSFPICTKKGDELEMGGSSSISSRYRWKIFSPSTFSVTQPNPDAARENGTLVHVMLAIPEFSALLPSPMTCSSEIVVMACTSTPASISPRMTVSGPKIPPRVANTLAVVIARMSPVGCGTVGSTLPFSLVAFSIVSTSSEAAAGAASAAVARFFRRSSCADRRVTYANWSSYDIAETCSGVRKDTSSSSTSPSSTAGEAREISVGGAEENCLAIFSGSGRIETAPSVFIVQPAYLISKTSAAATTSPSI